MSEFDDDTHSMMLEEIISDLEGILEERRQARLKWLDTEFRQIGYARYDKWDTKRHRFWMWVTRRPYKSREEWNEFVDLVVEEAKRRV